MKKNKMVQTTLGPHLLGIWPVDVIRIIAFLILFLTAIAIFD